MNIRPSLRLRLVLLTTLAVGIVWLVTAVVTWREALHEIEELIQHPPATTQHLANERDEIVNEIAEHLLKPMLIALPTLALVLAVAVGFALRPLRRLAGDLATRAPDRLTPIDASHVPIEIVPLVQRLNELFVGIDRALANERRFTADAAHELRTPLAALKAQAQVAQASTDTDERQRALGQIVSGCDRATHLVAQLLTLARLDVHALDHGVRVDLRALAGDVLAGTAGTAIAAGCELRLDEPPVPAPLAVKGDPVLIGVLLRNLVDNAIRHSGGKLITLDLGRDGGSAMLRVVDNGKGIPPEDLAHVEQRFHRLADAAASGSGLGLSIARRIVELMGGSMTLANAPAGGLVVTLRIPCLD